LETALRRVEVAGDDLRIAAQFWQTPNGQNFPSRKQVGDSVRQPLLEQEAQMWQTPGADSFRSRGGDRIDEPGLDQQARLWNTPRSIAAAGATNNMERDGQLREQASRFSRPTGLETTPDGPPSSPNAPTSRQRLNPAFVAWLMGWPDCLAPSGCGCSATASYLSRQRMRLSHLAGGS